MMFWFRLVVGLVALFDALSVVAYKAPTGRLSSRKQVLFLPRLSSKDCSTVVCSSAHTDSVTVFEVKPQLQPSAVVEKIDVQKKKTIHRRRIRGKDGNLVFAAAKKAKLKRRPFEQKVEALLRYKEIYGHMLVPCKFEIPSTSEWRKELWKMRLGAYAGRVRIGLHCSQEEKVILESIGFLFKFQYVNRYGFDVARETMLKYKELHGTMLISALFVIPESPDWPESMWGVKLGHMVNNVRRGSSYADKREELLEIGFVFESQHKYGFELVYAALKRFKELNTHVNVPSRWVVPETEEWAEEFWGMGLGTVVHDIRRGTYADKKKELTKLGFEYCLRKKFDYDCVKIAIYKYRELNHGSMRIPTVYNIKRGDSWYPEETWGMCLGSIVNRIRRGDIFADKRAELFTDYAYDHGVSTDIEEPSTDDDISAQIQEPSTNEPPVSLSTIASE